MKNSYGIIIDKVSLAVLDLCKFESGYIITRINVPAKYRGEGYGSQLLKNVTADADAENIILYLGVSPSGPLNYRQLFQWYKRYGFYKIGKSFYRRDPHGAKPNKP